MTFNDIPSAIRAPIVAIEFDNTGASTGSATKTYKALVIGQRLTTGAKAAGTISRVTSADQAGTYFGVGSLLHQMAKSYFPNNSFTETYFGALDDDAAGVFATGKISVVASSVSAGTLYLYIGGVQVKVGITANMTAAAAATAITDAINAITSLPVTAAVNGTNNYQVDITCKWKGETGNEIDIRANYNSGEVTPSGLTLTITAMASGTGNPDVSGVISAMSDVQYDVIVCPYRDSTNFTALETELSTRFGPLVQKEGFAFMAMGGTLANLATFGNGKNSKFFSCAGLYGSPTPAYQIAANIGAVVAYYSAIDPARQFKTLALNSVKAPAEADRFTFAERNSLLFDGISTLSVDSGGTVRIERLISMYQTNAAGAEDPSYLDITTLYTLGYLRYSLRNRIGTKYPRHKLADDGFKYPPSQAIVTPSVVKAECIALYQEWLEIGLVENLESFKTGLIVERNTTDRNRLDILMTPDLINSFTVCGVQIKFIL